MPEIRHQQPGAGPEVSLAEIHIPNDADLGTGTFTTLLVDRALLSNKVIASVMVNAPAFQVSVTINPNRDIVTLLGRADSPTPQSKVVFRLPNGLDFRPALRLVIAFAGGQIVAGSINGQPLGRAADPFSN
jgi:hypothetical protein